MLTLRPLWPSWTNTLPSVHVPRMYESRKTCAFSEEGAESNSERVLVTSQTVLNTQHTISLNTLRHYV